MINLRPLFRTLELDCQPLMALLKATFDFMRSAFDEGKALKSCSLKQFPTALIPTKLKPYLFSKPIGKSNYNLLDPVKYEYWVYQILERNLTTGIVSATHSVDYKSLEADLQLSKSWEKIKEDITQTTQVPALQKDIHTLLEELQVILEALIERVNKRIESGENKDMCIKKKSDKIRWSIPYLKMNPDYNNPFYDKLGHINITDLMAFVDQQCGFMKAFKHIKLHQTKKNVDYIYLIACLIANATGLGIYKMSESSQLTYDKLLHIQQSRIRLETLTEANRIISDHIQALPIFKYYNRQDGFIHGSADVQKIDVRLQTFISRYLRKYFKEKGVSVYTLLINNVAVNAKVINGHESHYLFDLICHNKTSIQPHMISTDTEGANQLNFALLDLKNILFAPCYKTITSKAKLIYTFKDPKYYQDYLIKPIKQIKKRLIINEWPNNQKVFTALLAGETTQSIIVKKFSSHKRRSKTKEALWEYNNILMSIYLL